MRHMPAIFFLTLPTPGETSADLEAMSSPEHADASGYSGHLSFVGGFDQFGFMPQRSYLGAVETNELPGTDTQSE